MNSPNATLILAVIARFADILEVTQGEVELEAIARMLSAQIPHDGMTGTLTATRAAEEACEALRRRLLHGELDDRREYLRFVFRSMVHGEDRPRRSPQMAAYQEKPDAQEPARRAQESYMSRARERRRVAIEEWRANPGKVPCPRWAIDGFGSPEEAEEAKTRSAQGLRGLPERPRPFTDRDGK